MEYFLQEAQKFEADRIRAVYRRRSHSKKMQQRNSSSNLDVLLRNQERERIILAKLTNFGLLPLEKRRVLEVGCNRGDKLLEFLQWGAQPENLYGVDLLFDAIPAAHNRLPGMNFALADGSSLPFEKDMFDIVLQSTVFSSILSNDIRHLVAEEMQRVLSPGGIIVWYDFMFNPTNPDVRGIRRREINALFPGCKIEVTRLTLAPPIARSMARFGVTASHLAGLVPVFKTHCLAILRPGSGQPPADLDTPT